MRVQAEQSIIEYLQNPNADYAPVNYYARFLKDRIMSAQASKAAAANGAKSTLKIGKKYF